MNYEESMLETLKQLPRAHSPSMGKHQRKKQLNELAESAKQQIHQTIIQYKRMLDEKQQQLCEEVNITLLNALEKINGLQVQFEEDNINSKIDNRLIFAPMLQQLSSIFNCNRTNTTDEGAIEKLQSKLEQAIINEQRLKQKLQEIKRKYRNKNKPATPPPLPMPSPTILSTRYRRQNQMLIQQNRILSSRLIHIQSEGTSYKREEDYEPLEKGKCDPATFSRQNEQYLNRQILDLREQLAESNKRLLQNEGVMYEKMRMLEMETERTQHEQTSRVNQLNFAIGAYEQKSRRLCAQIEELKVKITELQDENKELCKQKEGTVRKEVLQDVMKQLNEQMKANQSLKLEYQQIKSRLIAKESEFRNKQIEYAEKIDQYAIVNEKQYQELKKAHTKQIEEIEMQAGNTISILRKELMLLQDTSESKQHQVSRLAQELQSTKDQLKQTKRVKKQSVAKKHLAQKQSLQQIHAAEIKALNEEIAKYKSQYKILRQSYDNKLKLLDMKYKIMRERFQIDVAAKLEKAKQKSKLEAMQTAESLIQSFGNYVHKEAIITKLNRELNQLKSKKEKNLKPPGTAQEDIRLLNSQMLEERTRVQKSICDEKVLISEEKILKAEAYSQTLQTKIQQLETKLQSSAAEVKQMEKKLKEKLKAQSKEPNSIQQELREEIQLWKGKFNEMRKQRDDTQLEAKTKKDALNTLKAATKSHQSEISSQRKLNQELKEEIQKLKKSIKEYQRKDQVFKDNKEKLDNVRFLQKQNQQLRQQLEEKVKSFRVEVSKKDAVIKLMKEKEAAETMREVSKIETDNLQILDLEQQVRRLKIELQRKDSLIKIYKQKIDKLQEQIEKEQRGYEEKLHKEKAELIRETKKSQQLRLQNKRSQSQIFALKGILRKIHENFSQLQQMQKPKRKQLKQIPNIEIFSEGLSILNISPQELHNFLPEGENQVQKEGSSMVFVMKKVEQLMPLIKEQLYNQ